MAAVSSNALVVVAATLIGAAWMLWVVRRWRGHNLPMFQMTELKGLIVVGVVLMFGIARNFPAGAWFAP